MHYCHIIIIILIKMYHSVSRMTLDNTCLKWLSISDVTLQKLHTQFKKHCEFYEGMSVDMWRTKKNIIIDNLLCPPLQLQIKSQFFRLTGLLRSGAIKEEDRPIWYDVVKAFPPRPKPPPKQNIPNILYPEDFVRV